MGPGAASPLQHTQDAAKAGSRLTRPPRLLAPPGQPASGMVRGHPVVCKLPSCASLLQQHLDVKEDKQRAWAGLGQSQASSPPKGGPEQRSELTGPRVQDGGHSDVGMQPL